MINSENLQAFIDGYNYGIDYKEYLSTREVNEKFPWYGVDETECFLNGLEDGIKKDEFRIIAIEAILKGKK